MPIILRYIDDFKISERYIKFAHILRLTGISLAYVILAVLSSLKLLLKIWSVKVLM